MNAFYSHPLFGVSITLLAYMLATAAHRRWHYFNALLGCCGGVALLLVVAKIPYESYNVGGKLVTFFIGPATVAMAVPFYKHARQIGQAVPKLLISIGAGTLASMTFAAGVAWLAGAPHEVVLSIIARGVTTPIAMDVTAQIGGDPSLAALFTGISGLFGATVGPAVLKFVRVRHDLAIGAAMGTSVHGIGTARALKHSATAGGAGAFALVIAGTFTAAIAIPLRWLLRI